MPLYEYQCDACGHRFEVIQKYSDAPIEACPKCAGAVHKLLSSPAIQFKGSGWYITDYARAGKADGKADTAAPEGNGASGSSESKNESRADTKSESKSDAKSEPKSDTKSESKPVTPSTT